MTQRADQDAIPLGKFSRALTGGKTAAKVGGKMIGYYAKRPFLSGPARQNAREKISRESARTLFQGLSLLKGTALKMAQMLSLEMDILPEQVCKELAKAYHSVPPINRSLVRKVVKDGLGRPPEAIFSQFDGDAFAAASLGQVHRAVNGDGGELAVKIQYPGIGKTIKNDIRLMGNLFGLIIQEELLRPTLAEIAARLREEVDYLHEADNLAFFRKHLIMEGVRIPRALADLTSTTVLTSTLMPGKPLDQWLDEDHPGQEARDHIARKLNDLLLKGLYELHAIHADPNPGNFIIADDLSVGLVDFGCVKRLDCGFVEQYRQLALAAAHNNQALHFDLMIQLGLIPSDLDSQTRREIKEMSGAAGAWFSRLFADEFFDFKKNPGFIGQGQKVMRRFHHLQRHLRVNPDVIFLDRTRYGLLRIFEKMSAKVAFRNTYEW